MIRKEKSTLENYSKLYVMYNIKYSFTNIITLVKNLMTFL